ncbi:MAG: serine hydrolase [Verrucomicrobiia bacterium]
MNTKQLLLFPLLTVLLWPSASAAEPPVIPEEIKTEIRKRVDNLYSTALVVGVLDTNGVSYFSYGTLDPDQGGTVNEDSLFFVGGQCKTFTATILADMAERGELSLTNLIQDYLPAGWVSPTYGIKQIGINFLHLASHMSGLPNMPNELLIADPSQNLGAPGYTLEQMYDFLGSCHLTRAPGAQFEFSNYGIGLLGQILSHIKGTDFETLLRERVTDVLGLEDTVVKMSPAQAARAVAHCRGVNRLPTPDFGALAPTAEMYSTARDTLTFLAANLGLVQSPLYCAMTNAHHPRYGTAAGTRVGLAWETRTSGSVSCIERTGISGAFSGYTGFIPAQKRAVVVLATGSLTAGDLGRRLLSPAFPKFTSYPVPIQVPTRMLRQYVGTYTGMWNGGRHSFEIGLERGHLTFVWSGDRDPFTLYAARAAKNNIFRLPPSYDSSTSVQFNFDTADQVKSLTWNGTWGAAGPIPKVSSLALPPELALSRSESGATLELIGDPGSSYTIEWSSDLRTWSQLVPDVASGTSLPLSSAESARFYRARE